MKQQNVPRLIWMALPMLVFAACAAPPAEQGAADDDPYLWLEEVDGEEALAWVQEVNERSAADLKAHPDFESLYADALAALDSESRIPTVEQRGDHLYNFWRDDQNPRGVLRRTTLEELRRDAPRWETVLDIDALSEAEGEKWVYKGLDCLPEEHRKCLIRLSPGGGDAVTTREWDMQTMSFVEGGFDVPVAKQGTDWIDEDTLFVGTDFGEGSMTESGYPRIVKRWTRGTPLAEAETLYEGDPQSVWAFATRLRTDAGDIDLVVEGLDFWTSKRFQLLDGELHELDLPISAVIEDAFDGKLIVSLKEDWSRGETTWARGTVLIASPEALRTGGDLEVLLEPAAQEVVEEVNATSKGILLTMLDSVRGRLYRFEPGDAGWERRAIEFPDNGALHVATVDDETGSFFAEYESFTTPPTLFFVNGEDLTPTVVKAQDATFDGGRFEVEQHFAISTDGTRVPYFTVMASGTPLDGSNPTHIFSYGGFRNSLVPSYNGSYERFSGAYGKLWLERGGVFVLANIRGGGEFGPDWHSAALLENRHKAFEDFEAVAEDLIRRGVTSPGHLGIEGRSNGGLLVTATMIRRPDLYGAVVCGVPLTDMRRYHTLLAGASWMAEYGDPDDPDMWEYIRTYSPYHNLEEGQDYPPIFFYTSTRDDRVHPGHARKMIAKMTDLGYDAWYYENMEGGHGGSSTNEQTAYRLALAYSHLWSQLAPEARMEPRG